MSASTPKGKLLPTPKKAVKAAEKAKKAAVGRKKAVPRSTKSSRAKSPLKEMGNLLAYADASLSLSNFASIYSKVTVQACIADGRISKIGFASDDSKLENYLALIGDMVVGKSLEEVESLSLHEVFVLVSPPHEERLMVEYAFSAWQDVVSRLPTADPLSGALQSLKYYNREFPKGSMLPDLED